MTIMPEHNQYQLQQQSASKSSENLRTLLPLPPSPPAPSSTNKPFAKQMATLCLSNKPSCSRETLILNEDLPATILINESSGDETGSTCLREVTSSTSRLSPLLLLSFSAEDDDYFIEQSRQKSTKSAIAPSSRPPPAPLDYPSTHTLHPKNTLSSTSQSQQHRRLRQQQQHSVPMQIRSINNKLKKGPAVFNHQQCSRRFYQAKANRSSNKLLPTVYRSTATLVLLFLAVSALLPLTSLVQGMPQTSAVASSYHLKGGPQSARHNHNQHHHHHSHQSTPSSSSPYSLSSSSSASSSLSLSSAVQSPPPPQQQGNSYQAHGPHNMYHPFGSSSSISSPSSSVQHHQPLPVKSSSLVQQDSNNNHYHHSSSSALADPPTIVNGSCPTCGRRFDLQQAKDLKLEAIQQQILSKLNLMEKPKVNQNWLKREQALEAIRKAKLNSKIRGRSRSAAISNTGGGGGGGGINSAATNRKRHSRRESDTPVHRRLNFIESQHSSNYNRSSIVLYGNGALEDGTTTTTASAHGNNFDSLFGQDEDEEEEGEEEMESSTDEYYGKTSEIIAFAEPGRTINGHTLVDLTPPHDNLHKLAVTKAVLWARLIYNRTAVRAQFPKRKPVFSAPVTLYIFKVVNKSQQQQQTESWASNSVIYPTPFFQRSSEMHQRKTSGRSSSSSSSSSANYQQQNSGAAYNESNRLQFSLLTTHRLTKPSRGWTQIDLTAAVADWYAQASSAPFLAREKLTLLIDCVGCNQLLEIDLATGHRPAAQKKNRNNSNNSNNRPQKGSTAGNSRSGSKQSSFQTTSNNITSITSNQTIKSRNYSVGEKTNSQAVTALEAYHHKTPGARKPRRHFQPFVVITTRTKLKRRSRRHAYNCEDGKIKQCCKQSLYVDFSLLGWDDWIIYPKGYTANYCMGECVQLHRSPDVMAYFHSHVIEEYRMKNPYASITPCCAPTKLSSISLIYFDPEGHIIKSDLPKMVVDECGCT